MGVRLSGVGTPCGTVLDQPEGTTHGTDPGTDTACSSVWLERVLCVAHGVHSWLVQDLCYPLQSPWLDCTTCLTCSSCCGIQAACSTHSIQSRTHSTKCSTGPGLVGMGTACSAHPRAAKMDAACSESSMQGVAGSKGRVVGLIQPLDQFHAIHRDHRAR